MLYDHKNKTEKTLEDCESAVGETATLTLTGKIVEARESDAGAYVMFEIDERWGLGEARLGMDLDCFLLGDVR